MSVSTAPLKNKKICDRIVLNKVVNNLRNWLKTRELKIKLSEKQ